MCKNVHLLLGNHVAVSKCPTLTLVQQTGVKNYPNMLLMDWIANFDQVLLDYTILLYILWIYTASVLHTSHPFHMCYLQRIGPCNIRSCTFFNEVCTMCVTVMCTRCFYAAYMQHKQCTNLHVYVFCPHAAFIWQYVTFLQVAHVPDWMCYILQWKCTI